MVISKIHIFEKINRNVNHKYWTPSVTDKVDILSFLNYYVNIFIILCIILLYIHIIIFVTYEEGGARRGTRNIHFLIFSTL